MTKQVSTYRFLALFYTSLYLITHGIDVICRIDLLLTKYVYALLWSELFGPRVSTSNARHLIVM
jgi:hypothetical protein